MLKLLSPNDAERLRGFLIEAGYDEENLQVKLGIKDLPSTRLRNFPRLLDNTREPSRINTLLRWFWIGEGAEQERATKTIPPEILRSFPESGLLKPE